MPFILNVDALSEDMIVENTSLIQAYATQLIPNADFTKGTALYDLLIRPAAILQTLAETNMNHARLSGSLLRISQFPQFASPDMVDELLSNYRITRLSGETAAGTVEIKISSNVVTAIPSGSLFVSGGLRFFTTQPFVGVPSQGLVSGSTDRLIQEISTGVYAFSVDVVAENAGSGYQLSQGTTIVLQTPPSNYISSSALYDFTSGASAETNEQLINRMASGLANRTPGNRTNVVALMTEKYPTLRNTSIIGYGQPEMTRDQDNLFLFSYGGKSDIYAQTVARPQLVRLTKTATLVNKTSGAWQVYFNRDEFAGVYKLKAVMPKDLTTAIGSLKVITEVRTVDTSRTSTSDFTPHVDNFTQAAFSRYQTLTVEFLDPYTATTSLTVNQSTKEYYVDVLVMPGIAQIQDEVFSDPSIRAMRYDDLVRAPIPVLVSLSFGIRLRNGDSPNIPGMTQAIADRINQLGFRSSLSPSYVIDTVHGLLNSTSSVIMPVDMLGELIDPTDGASKVYRSAQELIIPDDSTKQISANTLMFFCDPANINIYTERA
jgi:hypothetical protein